MIYNIKDETLRKAAGEGMDAFVDVIVQAIKDGVGGELSSETMPKLTSQQITLLGYMTLRDEVMDGGFIQLIYNGYGPFFFKNPFDTAVRQWGMIELCRLMRHVKKAYQKRQAGFEQELSDDEFMALYEKMPEFDEFDDEFVSHEEVWTEMLAHFVDEHLDEFVNII